MGTFCILDRPRSRGEEAAAQDTAGSALQARRLSAKTHPVLLLWTTEGKGRVAIMHRSANYATSAGPPLPLSSRGWHQQRIYDNPLQQTCEGPCTHPALIQSYCKFAAPVPWQVFAVFAPATRQAMEVMSRCPRSYQHRLGVLRSELPTPPARAELIPISRSLLHAASAAAS